MVFVTILAHVNVFKTRKARTDLDNYKYSARQKMVLFTMGTVHAASATMEQYAIAVRGGLDRLQLLWWLDVWGHVQKRPM